MFIKSKIEPLTMALSEISSGLECFGFLNVMKAKSDALCILLGKYLFMGLSFACPETYTQLQ